MKTEGPQNSKPDDGNAGGQSRRSARGLARKMAAGAAQQEQPGKEEQDGRDPKIIEISSRPLQPKMKQEIVKRRVFVPPFAEKKGTKDRPSRTRSVADDGSLVINDRDGIVRHHEANVKQQYRDDLLGDFVCVMSARRHG